MVKTPYTNNLPIIMDVIEPLCRQAIISMMDVDAAYHRMWLVPKCQDMLSFSHDGEFYKFVGAPFGVLTLVYEFQKFITKLLYGIPGVVCYLDNIIVGTATVEQHIDSVAEVIDRCNKATLKLGLDKCHLGYERGQILGHVVYGSRRGSKRHPSQVQMKRVLQLPIPTSGKMVRSLLGMTNFVRDFIPNYSSIAAPLEEKRNARTFEPTEEIRKSVEMFKDALCNAPMLYSPKQELPFTLLTDGSGEGLGAVLTQEWDKAVRYIRFAATSLTSYQRNYNVTARELLALVFGLKAFEELITGRDLTCVTDHAALSFLFTHCRQSAVLSRYAQYLLKFPFKVIHRPGLEMGLPDALSRLYKDMPGKKCSVFDMRRPRILLNALKEAESTVESVSVMMTRVLPIAKSDVNRWLKAIDMERIEDLDEQKKILNMNHEMGHEGPNALIRRVMELGQVWDTLPKDAHALVESCIPCQAYGSKQKGYHPLKPITAQLPWERVAVDLAELKTSANKYTWLLVQTDICTRMVVLTPLKTKYAGEIAKALLHTWANFGIPGIMQSDGGGEFVNNLLEEVYKILPIAKRVISAFHPRANGSAERNVGLVKASLKKLVNGDWAHWDEYLALTQLTLNSRITRRHGTQPFVLMFNRKMYYASKEGRDSLPPLSEEELLKRMRLVQDMIWPAANKATEAFNEKMIAQWTKKNKLVKFKMGDTVLLERTDVSSKLEPKFAGPYQVAGITDKGAYFLEDAQGNLHAGSVPPSRLRRVAGAIDSNIHEVDKILNHKGKNDKIKYLVKWRGYTAEESTWEPVQNIFSPEAVATYWATRALKSDAEQANNSQDSSTRRRRRKHMK